MPEERLQKILAAAGIASRRKSEELITSGRVSVNGATVTEMGTKADPRTDEIRVDGKLLQGPERHVYLALYKPKGHVTTVSDPEGRPTVMDLLKGVRERVFPVGRLDYMSEGLLLLTNDGALMAKLTSPAAHVSKVYMVKVSGQPSADEIQHLRDGIVLPPEPGLAGARGRKQPGVERRSYRVRTLPAHIRLAKDQENPWYSVVLTEGRNRQIRRMFEQIGHHVEKIKRVQYGSLELDLEPGQWRSLTTREINQLRASIGKPFTPGDGRRPPAAMREEKPPRRAEFRGRREEREPRREQRPPQGKFREARPPRREFSAPPTPGAPRGQREERPPRAGRPELRARPDDRAPRRDERPPQREFRGPRPPRRDFAGAKPGAQRGERPPRSGRPEFRARPDDRGPRREHRPQGDFRGPRPPRREFSAPSKPGAPRGGGDSRPALGGRSGAPGQRRKGFRGAGKSRPRRP